jgi:FkbM family methyltransferase
MTLAEGLLKFPLKAYNGVFTPMGRRNLRNRLKMRRANLDEGFLKNGTLIYPLKNGKRFVFHRNNQLSELIFLEGAYEPLETLMVCAAVRENDVALDIGANVGYYTALLDGLVQRGGQVHSFEPGQGTFAKLEETKKLLRLDRTSLHRIAISDSVGHIDFWQSTSGSDAQQSTVKVAALGETICHNRVEATTLDAFMADLNAQGARDIAFVKCDIEGAELSMIKGARNLLTSEHPPVWLIEHNRAALLEHGNNSIDLVSPFSNFEIYYVPLSWPPSRMTATFAAKWSGVSRELPDECNLIILPKKGKHSDRALALRLAGLIP